MKALEEYAENSKRATSSQPNYTNLVAANGAGKDQMFIGPIVTWTMLEFPLSTQAWTSGGALQLAQQTEPAIGRWCSKFNTFVKTHLLPYGEIEIKQRDFKFPYADSHTLLYATDDAGKAEGFHPIISAEGRKLVLGANEAKFVLEEIFTSMRRCRGYTDFVQVSSPDDEVGHFYRSCMNPTHHTTFVDWTQCPHISKQEHDDLLASVDGDTSHWLYVTSLLARFCSRDAKVIITRKVLNECLARPPAPIGHLKSMGVDLSAVCDETVATIYKGNQFKTSYHRAGFANVTVLEDWLDEIYRYEQPNIVPMDYDGMGRGPVDNLIHRRGWQNVVPTLSGSTARRHNMFANRITELYAGMKRLIEAGAITIDPTDTKLHDQLCTRKIINRAGRDAVESKKDAAYIKRRTAAGIKSPDRADSLVLALSPFAYEEFAVPQANEEVQDTIIITCEEDYTRYLRNQNKQLTNGDQWTCLKL